MSSAKTGRDDIVVIGQVSGVYGVRGWVKVYSHTEPRDNILNYEPWLIKRDGQWVELHLLEGKRHGKAIVAHLEGIDDRDEAAGWLKADIAIHRSQLGAAAEGEYYWSDLVGLKVVNTAGVELGIVDHLLETGANDVLVVRGDRQRLIPFTEDAVVSVDLPEGRITVEWDADF